MGVRSGRFSDLVPRGRTRHRDRPRDEKAKEPIAEPRHKPNIRQRIWTKVHHHHNQHPQQQQQKLNERGSMAEDESVHIATNPKFWIADHQTAVKQQIDISQHMDVAMAIDPPPPGARVLDEDDVTDDESESDRQVLHERRPFHHINNNLAPSDNSSMPQHPIPTAGNSGMSSMPHPLWSRLAQFGQHNPVRCEDHITLYTAVRNDDIEGVQRLLNKLAPPSSRAIGGEQFTTRPTSPLISEPLRGNNSSALYEACNRGNLAIVQALLQAGVSPEVGTVWGGTPLHIAAQRGRTTIARLLLRAGADPTRTSKDGATPLLLAARWGKVAVCRLLLAASAGGAQADAHRRAALIAARDCKQAKVLRWMARTERFSALHHACEMVDPDRVRDILRSDQVFGQSLLHRMQEHHSHHHPHYHHHSQEGQVVSTPLASPLECSVFSPLKSTQNRPADLARLVADLRAGEGEYSPTSHHVFPAAYRQLVGVLLKRQFVLSRRRRQQQRQWHQVVDPRFDGTTELPSRSQVVASGEAVKGWGKTSQWEEVVHRLVNAPLPDLLAMVLGYCGREWFVPPMSCDARQPAVR
jgi:hypothetical protein